MSSKIQQLRSNEQQCTFDVPTFSHRSIVSYNQVQDMPGYHIAVKETEDLQV